MQIKTLLFTFAYVGIGLAALEERATGRVLTAERVFQTVIQESPFLVFTTTTVTWTQSPSITEAQPTDPPTPTIEY